MGLGIGGRQRVGAWAGGCSGEESCKRSLVTSHARFCSPQVTDLGLMGLRARGHRTTLRSLKCSHLPRTTTAGVAFLAEGLGRSKKEQQGFLRARCAHTRPTLNCADQRYTPSKHLSAQINEPQTANHETALRPSPVAPACVFVFVGAWLQVHGAAAAHQGRAACRERVGRGPREDAAAAQTAEAQARLRRRFQVSERRPLPPLTFSPVL